MQWYFLFSVIHLPTDKLEWNNLDISYKNSTFVNIFKEELLKFVRSEPKTIYEIRNIEMVKLLKRLRLELSDLGHSSGVKRQPTENQMPFSQTVEFCYCLFSNLLNNRIIEFNVSMTFIPIA